MYKGHSDLSFKSARMSFKWLYKGVLRETSLKTRLLTGQALLIVSYKTFFIENMAKNTKEIGDLGEGIAEKWLKSKGFSILDRNYWKKWGEIDIVAKKPFDKAQERGPIIHFVEVKSTERANLRQFKPENDSYRPEEKVHPQKLKRMSRVIQSYLIEKNIEGEWQFDVLVVYLDPVEKLAKVKYLPNIVL